MWRRPILIVLLSAAIALPAFASGRPFPANAKRGTMTPAGFPEIVINGQSRELSPGARIWGENNLIQMPASLRGSQLTVNYTEDGAGQIDKVWILDADEARESIETQTHSKPQ